MERIDITNLDRAEVLLSLYNHAKCQGEFYASIVMPILASQSLDGSLEKAEQFVLEMGDKTFFTIVDLGQGPRELYLDLKGPFLNSETYDAAHGIGQAEKAINLLKERLRQKSFFDFLLDASQMAREHLASQDNKHTLPSQEDTKPTKRLKP